MKKFLLLTICFLIGILLFYMLKNHCDCKVVEGFDIGQHVLYMDNVDDDSALVIYIITGDNKDGTYNLVEYVDGAAAGYTIQNVDGNELEPYRQTNLEILRSMTPTPRGQPLEPEPPASLEYTGAGPDAPPGAGRIPQSPPSVIAVGGPAPGVPRENEQEYVIILLNIILEPAGGHRTNADGYRNRLELYNLLKQRREWNSLWGRGDNWRQRDDYNNIGILMQIPDVAAAAAAAGTLQPQCNIFNTMKRPRNDPDADGGGAGGGGVSRSQRQRTNLFNLFNLLKWRT